MVTNMSLASSAASKRRYRMSARSAAVRAREDRIIDAALRLFLARPYDEVSLQAVADSAGVSLKTVVRRFGTRDVLLFAGAPRREQAGSAARAVAPCDSAAVAQVLAERYEELGAVWLRFLALEDRIAAVAEIVAIARDSHRKWLARVFAPLLVGSAATRKERLAALFGATEFYVWHSWRAHLGLAPAAATRAMAEMLDALVERWRRQEGAR
jgi:AcrR family transcriptional regulator